MTHHTGRFKFSDRHFRTCPVHIFTQSKGETMKKAFFHYFTDDTGFYVLIFSQRFSNLDLGGVAIIFDCIEDKYFGETGFCGVSKFPEVQE